LCEETLLLRFTTGKTNLLLRFPSGSNSAGSRHSPSGGELFLSDVSRGLFRHPGYLSNGSSSKSQRTEKLPTRIKSGANGLFAALLEFLPRGYFRTGGTEFLGPLHPEGFQQFGLA